MRPEIRKLFLCQDCGFDTFCSEYYMVKHSIWKLTGIRGWGKMLCIGCLERRIKRKLVRNDFLLGLPINQDYKNMSSRLLDRLGVIKTTLETMTNGQH